MQRAAIVYALASAALFGASTPLAKLLVGAVQPLLLAGVALSRQRPRARPGPVLAAQARHARGHLSRGDLPWLAGAIAAGGIVGPALLMLRADAQRRRDGLAAPQPRESVLTAAIAWVVFRENVDRRMFLGAMAILAGGVVLSWDECRARGLAGPLLIAGACLAWGIDNNLTRACRAAIRCRSP